MLHVTFSELCIPGNTRAAIRLSANTGSMLHLVDPLFDMDDVKLRRTGLDYHDLVNTRVHVTWQECLEQIPGRIFVFTSHTECFYTQVDWCGDDVLPFGPKPTSLPQEILDHPRVSAHLRIPVVGGSRSLNLANSVVIDPYEAWRSLGLVGGA